MSPSSSDLDFSVETFEWKSSSWDFEFKTFQLNSPSWALQKVSSRDLETETFEPRLSSKNLWIVENASNNLRQRESHVNDASAFFYENPLRFSFMVLSTVRLRVTVRGRREQEMDAAKKKWMRKKKKRCDEKIKQGATKKNVFFVFDFFDDCGLVSMCCLGKKNDVGLKKISCGSCSITFIDVMLEKRFVSWNRFILVFRKRYQIYKANPWKQFVLVSPEYWTWTWFLLNSEYVWVSVSERDISLHSLLSSDCVIPFFC